MENKATINLEEYFGGCFVDILGKRRARVIIANKWDSDSILNSLPAGSLVFNLVYDGNKNVTIAEILLHGTSRPLK